MSEYYHIREAYQACIKPGDSNLYIKTDAVNTAKILDCPYRPSNSASGYPGQACYGAMIANNAAVDTGMSVDSRDFPVPVCGRTKEVITCSNDVPPVCVSTPKDIITCGSLKKRFAPNQNFSGCVEVAHEPGLYYDTREECERDCKTTDPITSKKLSTPGFCSRVPVCALGGYDTLSETSRPGIASAYACFLCRTDGRCSYTLIPPPDNVSCSTILRKDPTL